MQFFERIICVNTFELLSGHEYLFHMEREYERKRMRKKVFNFRTAHKRIIQSQWLWSNSDIINNHDGLLIGVCQRRELFDQPDATSGTKVAPISWTTCCRSVFSDQTFTVPPASPTASTTVSALLWR